MHYRRPVIVLTALLCSMSLSGCLGLTEKPQIRATYPSSLFKCPDAPDFSTVVTDNELAVKIVELAGAHEQCKSQLRVVGELVNPEREDE